MKTRNILLVIAVMVLAACTHQPKSFKVVGTTTGLPDSCQVFVSTTGTYRVNLDSTLLMDGKFEMELPYDSVAENTQLYIICLKKDTPHDRWTSAEFYAEPGATIQIHLDLEEANNNTVGGSPLNDIQNKYMKELDVVADEFFKARIQANDETLTIEERAKAEAATDSLNKEIVKVHEKYAIDHANTLIGVSIFSQFGKYFTPEGKQKLLEALPEKYKSHPAVVAERKRMEVAVNTVEGKPFTDFEMPAPDGKMVKLSDFVSQSKLTLVDFWASWCGPCRKEIPFIKKIYADYKNKGLGLVGVSLDEDKDKWVQDIANLKLDYPQMSDLKGWESVGAVAYNIEAIPFTLLIAQDGTIVAKNLRGEELAKRIEEFFKK